MLLRWLVWDINFVVLNLSLRNAVAVVGLGYLLRAALHEVWTLANGFCAYFLAPQGVGRTDLRKYGSWAGK